MRLKNETDEIIIIKPGEELEVKRYLAWLDEKRDLRYLSVDKLKDGYEPPELDEEIECPHRDCNKVCKNEHGLRVHWGRMHKDEDIEIALL